MNEKHKSNYNKIAIDWILKYYPSIPLGECDGVKNIIKNSKKIYSLDCSKAYTSCLISLEKIFKCEFFEIPKKYDGHEINDFYIYNINLLETDDIYNMSFTNIFGFNLKKLYLEYKIIEYLEYSQLIKNKHIKKEIKKIYNDKNFSE